MKKTVFFFMIFIFFSITVTVFAQNDKKIPVSEIFIPAIVNLEKKNEDSIFSVCKIISNFPNLNMEILSHQKSDKEIQRMLNKYIDCMAYYGAIIAEGGLYIRSKTPVGKKDDLIKLAEATIEKIVSQGFRDKKVSEILVKVLTRENSCTFDNSYNHFICGQLRLSLKDGKLFDKKTILFSRNENSNFYGYNISFKEN